MTSEREPLSDHRLKDLFAQQCQGDARAAGELFGRYAVRLIALARSRLSAKLATRVDPEDIVQSAYRSFFTNARAGHYDVQSGQDLWQLLVTITLHKILDQAEHFAAQKRDVRREQNFGSEDSLLGLQAHLASREPSPVEAVALVEEVEQAMRRLEPRQRRMLELRLQGFSIEEIAATMQRSEGTVRRALADIRQELQRSGAGRALP
jgi:RNA polymerase sigma-70 factor (ECF subfamily)